MRELQKRVNEHVMEQGGYWLPFQMLAALVEEVGELAESMLIVEGVKGHGDIEKVKEEIGDVIYALLCIANYYGIDAEEALNETIAKYRKRNP